MPLKYKLEEVLTENSPVTRKVLKDYLAKYNVLEYKCAICNNRGEFSVNTSSNLYFSGILTTSLH